MASKLNADSLLRLVVFEIGCGLRVPTIRKRSEDLCAMCPRGQATLIRINPEHAEQFMHFAPNICISGGAEASLSQIDRLLMQARARSNV